MDWDRAYILGLSSNFFHILQNIPTVFGITRGGHSLKSWTHTQLIAKIFHLGPEILYGGGVWCKISRMVKEMVKFIGRMIIQIIAQFLICDLVGI